MSRTKIAIEVAVVLILVLGSVGGLMVFNKSPDLLNSEFRIIVTGSMDGEPQDYDIKTIPINSLIAVHKLQRDQLSDIKVGDVIGFYSPLVNGNVYHRVVSIDSENMVFHTKGDNAPAGETVAFDQVNGIVVNVSHPAGEVVRFVQSNMIFIVIVVVLLFIMAEAFLYLLKNWKE